MYITAAHAFTREATFQSAQSAAALRFKLVTQEATVPTHTTAAPAVIAADFCHYSDTTLRPGLVTSQQQETLKTSLQAI